MLGKEKSEMAEGANYNPEANGGNQGKEGQSIEAQEPANHQGAHGITSVVELIQIRRRFPVEWDLKNDACAQGQIETKRGILKSLPANDTTFHWEVSKSEGGTSQVGDLNEVHLDFHNRNLKRG